MALRCFSTALIAFCLSAPFLHTALAQNPATPTQAPSNPAAQSSQPGYTFRAESRVVLTDVTVLDRQGNPVHGLPASAFHIFDNKKPQTIASFEEHKSTPGTTMMPASTSPGVYSNDYLLHLPPVLNIILIDTTNLEITDQMYLNYQLTLFFKTLPAEQPIAFYLRAGSKCILLQNFTSDRTLLQTALRHAIPRFPPPGREYLTDSETLHQIAVYLSQLPGRKNILWFTGGSTAYLRADATIYQYDPGWRAIYDELEQERIAIYPIDARGLTVNTGPLMWAQQGLMEDVANATGGQALYNNNGLSLAAAHFIDTDRSFYTLTYSPQNFHFDNKWHKVRVEVEGGYQLSYRRGYFADGSVPNNPESKGPRMRLLAGGEKVMEPELHSVPIVFSAHVLAEGEGAPGATSSSTEKTKRGAIPLAIRYTLPAEAFTKQANNGESKIVLGVAAFAFNGNGTPVERRAEQVTITAKTAALEKDPQASFNFDQQVNLPKGENYLYLAVWDLTNGRLGTVQMPVEVKKPAKTDHEK
jgi:VWFA-related protein